MESILIFAVIVVVIAALCIWLVDQIPIGPPFNMIARVLIIVVAILCIADRAGFI
jgi:hypothetical protein